VAFSPDGRTLAVGVFSVIQLWDMSDPAHPVLLGRSLDGGDIIYKLTFSPDGRILANNSGANTVKLWNMSDPALPKAVGRPLDGNANGIGGVAFSPDGHVLAVASAEGTIKLWLLSK